MQHTVTVRFEDGWVTTQMTCPFDLADQSRPCWPVTDHGEPEDPPQEFCNWKEWFDSSGGPESMREAHVATVPVEAEWDGDAMWFSVSVPEPVASEPDRCPNPECVDGRVHYPQDEPCSHPATCGWWKPCPDPWHSQEGRA